MRIEDILKAADNAEKLLALPASTWTHIANSICRPEQHGYTLQDTIAMVRYLGLYCYSDIMLGNIFDRLPKTDRVQVAQVLFEKYQFQDMGRLSVLQRYAEKTLKIHPLIKQLHAMVIKDHDFSPSDAFCREMVDILGAPELSQEARVLVKYFSGFLGEPDSEDFWCFVSTIPEAVREFVLQRLYEYAPAMYGTGGMAALFNYLQYGSVSYECIKTNVVNQDAVLDHAGNFIEAVRDLVKQADLQGAV